MWYIVGFLLFLLLFSSSGQDVKTFEFVEDDLHNSSAQFNGQESSCYRKGNPDERKSMTFRCEGQNFRPDSNKAAYGGSLSPSIIFARSSDISPSTNLASNKLVPSEKSSVVESPSIFFGDLPLKRHNRPFPSSYVHIPRRYLLAAPSLAVEPSMNLHVPNQFFPRLALDHMTPSGTLKFSNPFFLPEITSNSRKYLMSLAPGHSSQPFVSPLGISPREPAYTGAPYSFVAPSSLTTGRKQPIQVPSLPYDPIRSGPSLPPTENSQSQKRQHPGKYIHALSPSSVPTYNGKHQDLSPNYYYASENRPSARFLPPSNGSPVIAYSPTVSNGEQAPGSSVNKIQPPKFAPPPLLSPQPPTLKPPLVPPQNHQHQMHPIAFYPVISNPSTKQISPEVFGIPSQVRPPVVHPWPSVPPPGLISLPPNTSPSEPTVGDISMPASAPLITFPSGSHNRGPLTSAPSIFTWGTPQNKPSMPVTAVPRNRSSRRVPVATPPSSFSSSPIHFPSKSPMESSTAPEVAPFARFSPPLYQHYLKEPAASPIIFPAEPWKNSRIPVTAPIQKIPSRRVPFSSLPIIQGSAPSPQISLPLEPPSGNGAPSFKGTGYPSPNLPSESQEAPPPIIFPSHERHQNVKGLVAASPSVSPSKSPEKKPIISHPVLPRNRSKRQAPVTQAHMNKEAVTPISLPSEPEIAPSIMFRSPVYHGGVQGPTISHSNPHLKKSRMTVANQTGKRSWGHAPVTTVPVTQGPVSSPLIVHPPEQPTGNSRTTFGPSIIFPSPSHHSGVQGHVTSPSSDFYGAPQTKPRIFVAPSPMISSHWHAPTVIPPTPQGPTASPLIAVSQPPQNMQRASPVPSLTKRPWRHAPVAVPPIYQGSVPNPFTVPSGPPRVNSTKPAFAPRTMFPTAHHHRGPVTSPPSMIPSRAPQRKASIPVAAPPSKRLWKHAPVASLPIVQGHVYSPVNSPHPPSSGNLRRPTVSPPAVFPSPTHTQPWKHAPVARPPMIQGPVYSPVKSLHPLSSGNLKIPAVSPLIIFPSPPHHLSQKHAPVASPHMESQGSVYSPVKSPHLSSSGNMRTPTVSPSIIFPSPPRYRSWKDASVASPHTSQGPVYSPAKSPHLSSSGNLRTPTVSPSIIFPAPPHYRSWKDAPVASPHMSQGPVYSQAKSPHLSSSGNSRTPTVSPSIIFHAPPQYRPWKHAPVASPPMSQGPVYSPAKSPHLSSSGNVRTPTVPPSIISPSHAHLRLRKHAPVASPPMSQGPAYSQAKSPHLSSSGNLRTPTVSPSIIFRAPPQYRPWKRAPVASPPMSQGPVYSPAKSPHLSSSGNLRTPTVSPSIISPSHAHHRLWKHAPVASAPMSQGSVYSPVKSPLSSLSGNMRTPTVSPSIIFHAPPQYRPWKPAPVASPPMSEGPVYSPAKSPHLSSSGNLRTPTVSPSIIFPSPPHHRSRKHAPVASPPMSQGPGYSPVKSPHLSLSGNLRTPTVSPSIIFPYPPHHQAQKHAPVASPPMRQGPAYSPVKSSHPLPSRNIRSPAASPSNVIPSSPHHGYVKGSLDSPAISPSKPPEKTPTIPVTAPPVMFPPPPPGQDCSSMSCTAPYTSTPPGSPCGCVNPMQVELGLGVALYAFFPLVSELASEIAAGTFLKQSQVRIMGANAYSEDQEKTIVDIDLVPLGENFDNTTAFLIFERFWQKQVMINETLFGDYWVLYVHYPGLPQSPPSAFSNGTRNGVPNSSSSSPNKKDPFGVDVNQQGDKLGAGTIAVIVFSSAIAVIIFLGTVWIILLKCRNQNRSTSAALEPTLVSSITKRSGTGGGSILSGSVPSSTSMSFASSMATYTGSAKTFTSAELEKATDRYNPQNILGEGGFGRVYRGVLEDGTEAAVKVLTRDDQQGGREFIAEVEMLSRLHHRNLVKLIGICTEEHNRSLVYELIPNGSVESHLHGLDKEVAPLDWDARIKIALGAARGLAYLHEDSSPRVIHRDFKASNILLEDDFTPKVSDFGLAKSASEEVSGHISTRVMGTFGYVAPEYAMTGHLLVKSDVYSYGVVLLELLSGRKPVDMSQPPGQENLVTWARPLLTSKEGLETLVDPALGSNLPFDNIARVAAIASMCVQPDHSHRPFMGEVVQALKLVYNDSDASNAGGSGSFSRGESSAHDTELKDISSQPWLHSMQYIRDSTSFVTIEYDSGPLHTQGVEVERPLSASALISTSGRLMRQLSGSFRRHSSSGPLRTNKSKESWYKIRGMAGGSISEHGVQRYVGRGLDGDVHELWP